MLSLSPFSSYSLYLREREREGGIGGERSWSHGCICVCCFHLLTCLAPPPPHGPWFGCDCIGSSVGCLCYPSLIFWGGMLSWEGSRVSLLRFTVAHISETPLATGGAPLAMAHAFSFHVLFLWSIDNVTLIRFPQSKRQATHIHTICCRFVFLSWRTFYQGGRLNERAFWCQRGGEVVHSVRN